MWKLEQGFFSPPGSNCKAEPDRQISDLQMSQHSAGWMDLQPARLHVQQPWTLTDVPAERKQSKTRGLNCTVTKLRGSGLSPWLRENWHLMAHFCANNPGHERRNRTVWLRVAQQIYWAWAGDSTRSVHSKAATNGYFHNWLISCFARLIGHLFGLQCQDIMKPLSRAPADVFTMIISSDRRDKPKYSLSISAKLTKQLK